MLQHLDLSVNKIDAEGVGWLACVLRCCKSLDHLYLGGNAIRPSGRRRLRWVLRQCPWLTVRWDYENEELGEEEGENEREFLRPRGRGREREGG
eukprot:2362342-Rhodomonas_salina.1